MQEKLRVHGPVDERLHVLADKRDPVLLRDQDLDRVLVAEDAHELAAGRVHDAVRDVDRADVRVAPPTPSSAHLEEHGHERHRLAGSSSNTHLGRDANMNPFIDRGTSPNMHVFFYKDSDDNGFLSQWFKSDFYVDEQLFTTAEQFMMYMKAKIFDDTETMEKILSTPNEHTSYHRTLGKQARGFDYNKWSDVSLMVVAAGNYYEFSQNDMLKYKLLKTRFLTLVEASPLDRTWGIGYSKEDAMENLHMWGENRLGKALIMVRERCEFEFEKKGTRVDNWVLAGGPMNMS